MPAQVYIRRGLQRNGQYNKDSQPHDHQFTNVGDHNYCRNPVGSPHFGVWCKTSDPNIREDYCSVPFCPPLKVFDFSLDNNWRPSAKKNHVSLKKENLPSSFTICLAFMVEEWGLFNDSPLFRLIDVDNKKWLYVEIIAKLTHTEFLIHFSDGEFTATLPLPFFRMQWTRLCFSFNSNNSLATFVVDGQTLAEETVTVNDTPSDLHLILGMDYT